MKAISRRLRRLEDRFCPPVETEFDRHLLARIEAGRRRIAASGVPDSRANDADERVREDVSGLSVEQILLSGRAEARPMLKPVLVT